MQTLSIHRSSLNQALETGSPYINLLLFKLTLIDNADNSNPMDLTELVKLCSDRQKVKRSKNNNPNSLPIQATHISDPTLSFVLPSTRKMAHHFGVDKSTIYCIYSFWESIQGKLDSYYSLILNINHFISEEVNAGVNRGFQ